MSGYVSDLVADDDRRRAYALAVEAEEASGYDPYADDHDTCGWCGHSHARDHDCGCAPCPDCGDYHGPSGGRE